MANTTSNIMANVLLGGTGTKNTASEAGGRVRIKRGTVSSAAADAAGHLYPLARFKATDRLIAIYLNNTADAGWTDMNIGVYAGAADGLTTVGDWGSTDQTAVDADILVDGASLALASAGHDELLGTGSNAFAENLEGSMLWEMAGVASAPAADVQYDVVMESVANPAGGATLGFTILYTTGD